MHKNFEFRKDSIDYNENKILFLDIDGVIQNSQKRFEHDMQATCLMLAEKYDDDIYIKMQPSDVCAAYYDWNNIAIGITHEILETTHANIVLSSDWRESKSFDEMKALFRLYNLDRYFIACCNPNISKEEAIIEYVDDYKPDKYVVVDDRNFYQTFGEKYRNTRGYINIDDYYYIRMVLNSTINFIEEDKYICFPDSLTLKYNIDTIDDKKIMFIDGFSSRRSNVKYLLEYLFSYMIVRKNIDLYIFNPNGLELDYLKINGYKASDGNYYIFKDRYSSSELNNIINKIKVKKL